MSPRLPVSPHRRRHPALARRLAGLALLVLALLWAQLLGLAHGVRHAAGGGAAAAGVVVHAAGQDVLAHLAAAAGDEGPDCRLYDQIGHGGLIAVPLLWGAALLPQVWAEVPRAVERATACAPYAARAPPRAR